MTETRGSGDRPGTSLGLRMRIRDLLSRWSYRPEHRYMRGPDGGAGRDDGGTAKPEKRDNLR